jgi:hypothetical protein
LSHRRCAPGFALAIALGFIGCGEGVVLPPEGAPARVEVVSGNEQFGPAGSQLGQALVVKVTDASRRPVVDQTVTFSVDAGAGEITPPTASTNADGLASAAWRLGPNAGPQRVLARATGNGAPASLPTAEFTATATSGSAGVLEIFSGDAQVGSVGSALAEPLVVRVTDGLGNGVAGVTVLWTVGGGGTIEPATSVTGPDGTASAERVLGATAGEQSAQAAVEGLTGSPVTFTHTADASNPTELIRISGDGQAAPAGFQLPDSLVVRLLDPNGNGVGGRPITWVVPAGAGVVNPVNTTTDPQGFAVTRWTLGAAAGSYTINAVFSGLPSVGFTATATADVPTTIALLSGNGQTGVAGTNLPSPLRVRVTDANGNPVENVSVTWDPAGGGSVSSTTTGTNAQGIAEVTRTLGTAPGTYTTTATVEGLSGSPVTFTSIAEVGQAARLVLTTQPSGTVVGQTLPTITVEVQDAQGNRVVNATNRVTISSSVAGSLSGDNQQDAVAGIATFDALRITRAGTGFRLTALASGLASSTSEPFDVARGATTIAITNQSETSTVSGESVTITYDINVVPPAAGTPTGGSGSVTVSDGTQSCSGSVSGTGAGSCTIPLRGTGTHTLTASYNGDANFEGSQSAGVPHEITKASTNINITGDAPDPSAVGQDVTVQFTLTVNSPGSGTPTGSVTLTITDGPETATCPLPATSCVIQLQATGNNRTLTATYSGDGDFNGDSDNENHSVRTGTTTTVTTSATSAVFGESVTFTATVAPVPPAGGTPTGSVQFQADGANLGATVALSGGVASRSTNGLSVGSHVITATYVPSGGSAFSGSTGTLAPDQVVTQASTTTAITGVDPNLPNPGQTYTVSVAVAPVAPGGGTPAGTVSISDGEGGGCTTSLGGGSGSCSMSTSTPGAKTLTATYEGSTNHGGSSGTVGIQINTPPVANNDAVEVGIFGGGGNVLTNDTDAEGHSLQASLVDQPSEGSVILAPDGTFSYTPGPTFSDSDTFTYRATDAPGAQSNIATVTITVAGP